MEPKPTRTLWKIQLNYKIDSDDFREFKEFEEREEEEAIREDETHLPDLGE